MFRDTQEELERLSAELKEQDEEETAFEEEYEEAMLQQEDCAVYNTDDTDICAQDLSDELLEQEQTIPSLTGLTVTALILALGVLGLLIYWVLALTGGVKW